MSAENIREPIISVLGHVDHGKTTLLDYIRGTVVASREAGGITQHIGATDVPFKFIRELCGSVMEKLRIKTEIRGLLFIDTPGHEAFTNLRKRGGSVADIAILVVDVNDGIMPQTLESIQILKNYRVPFVVAANKIDRIAGWRRNVGVEGQIDSTKEMFYKKIYGLVGQLSEHGFKSDIFSNIDDFTQEIAVVPISAKTGYGIPELLMVVIGLTQQYLRDKLTIDMGSPAKGTILEVKDERGLGTTIDVIIYEGIIRKNDSIVVGGRQPILTKVKALLKPRPLDEMRDPRDRFQQVDEVCAASGVKIVAPNLEDALAGSPVYVGDSKLVGKVREEMGEVEIHTDQMGAIIKADTIGSLEALTASLKKINVPIKKGMVGKVTNQDIIEASAVSMEDKYLGVIIAFNSEILEGARNLAEGKNIKMFQGNVIYKIIEDYELWVEKEKERDRMERGKTQVMPAKLKILPGCVFRESKPAIVGVEVIAGTVSPGFNILRKDGKVLGRVNEIQMESKTVKSASEGENIAMSIRGLVVGRHLNEGDIFYTNISKQDIREIKEEDLSQSELKVLGEISRIKRGKVIE